MVISSKIKMMVLGGVSLILAGCMDTTSAPVDGSGRAFQTATYNHWDVRGRFTTRDDLFQNVTQADLITLLSGKTFVGYEESDGRGGAYGALSVRFFGADGSLPGCIVDYITGKPLDGAYAMKQWISRTAVNSNIGFEFSEFEVIELVF